MKEPKLHSFIRCRRCKIRVDCITCTNIVKLEQKFHNSCICIPCYYKKQFPRLLSYPVKISWHKQDPREKFILFDDSDED